MILNIDNLSKSTYSTVVLVTEKATVAPTTGAHLVIGETGLGEVAVTPSPNATSPPVVRDREGADRTRSSFPSCGFVGFFGANVKVCENL